MAWFFLSLMAAFSLATADAITKKGFSHLSPYEMGLTRLTYTLPWLIGSLFFIDWPDLDGIFFLCLAAGLPLEALAFFCYMKAIKLSPLSLTLPFLAFTPIFIILTGWMVLGETVNSAGFCGILLIVIGSYFLNFSHIHSGLMDPFRAIFREPGSRLMLLVSFLYSLTSTIGKLGILHSSPAFFGIAYFTSFSLVVALFLPFAPGAGIRVLAEKPRIGILLGSVMAVMIFSHMVAISLVQAVYMISLKRTSLFFGVLYGAVLFREEKITQRLTGASIMVAGVLVIGFYT
ncbi:MAG: EamA family transporter [Desulfomonilia bacterium]